MLLRFAKLAGGLRLLIAEVAPLVVVSASLLSARSVVYFVGFTLGSILSIWFPIVVTLVTIAGITAPANQSECDAYYAQVNLIVQRNYQRWNQAFYDCYKDNSWGCAWDDSWDDGVVWEPIPCTPPNCNGRKVWLQTIWASQSNFGSQPKGCFLIAYSYNDTDGLKIEYNPFKLPVSFLRQRALPHQVVKGNRFKQLSDKEWKDLETVQGWDKGYWSSEFTDIECRGWRPGWTLKVK
jgi:hypothetical protein